MKIGLLISLILLVVLIQASSSKRTHKKEKDSKLNLHKKKSSTHSHKNLQTEKINKEKKKKHPLKQSDIEKPTYHADEKYCNTYFLCSESQGTCSVHRCPINHIWISNGKNGGHCEENADKFHKCIENFKMNENEPYKFECPKIQGKKLFVNGFFGDENDCNSFYHCLNGNEYGYVCPTDLFWDITTGSCSSADRSFCATYVGSGEGSGLPDESSLKKPQIKHNSKKDKKNHPLKQSDVEQPVYHADKKYCNTYFSCFESQGTCSVHRCPMDHIWISNGKNGGHCEVNADKLSACIEKSNMNKNEALIFECPTITGKKWFVNGFFGDENNCNSFYHCINGDEYGYVCPPELYWDTITGSCLTADKSVCATNIETLEGSGLTEESLSKKKPITSPDQPITSPDQPITSPDQPKDSMKVKTKMVSMIQDSTSKGNSEKKMRHDKKQSHHEIPVYHADEKFCNTYFSCCESKGTCMVHRCPIDHIWISDGKKGGNCEENADKLSECIENSKMSDNKPHKFECPTITGKKWFVNGFFGDENDCNSFYHCIDGEKYAIKCPRDSFWNCVTGSCSSADKSYCATDIGSGEGSGLAEITEEISPIMKPIIAPDLPISSKKDKKKLKKSWGYTGRRTRRAVGNVVALNIDFNENGIIHEEMLIPTYSIKKK